MLPSARHDLRPVAANTCRIIYSFVGLAVLGAEA